MKLHWHHFHRSGQRLVPNGHNLEGKRTVGLELLNQCCKCGLEREFLAIGLPFGGRKKALL